MRAILEDLLGANRWMRVKVLTNKSTTDIEDAVVEFEWTCFSYGIAGNPGFALSCHQCTIPASSGLFEWYRSIYGNNNDKSLDEPAMFYSTPSAAAVAEHRNAPPPPLEKRRNTILEGIIKDPVFGERVEWSRLFVDTYPVEIGKHWKETEDTELLDVYFKAESALWIKKDRFHRT